MKIIPNERKHVEECLSKSYIDKKPTKTLIMFIKYYHELGLTNNDIYSELVEYMTDAYAGFIESEWTNKLDELIVSYAKDEYKLNNVKSVEITKGEMDNILKVKNDVLERILFTMLVYCKVNNQIRNHESNWITNDANEICKDANVKRKRNELMSLFYQLTQKGYIEFGKKVDSLSKELKYVDRESPTVITITSFEDFILDYHMYKGQKVIECKECGKRIIVKGKSPTKYCTTCAKNKQNEHKRNYKKSQKTLEKTNKNQDGE